LGDLTNSKMFTVTSAIEGETEKHGKYVCREYQDVFILKWKGGVPMEANDFVPIVKEEVSGFEIMKSWCQDQHNTLMHWQRCLDVDVDCNLTLLASTVSISNSLLSIFPAYHQTIHLFW
jgi:hypothetical protein